MVGTVPVLNLARCVLLWQRNGRGPRAAPWTGHRQQPHAATALLAPAPYQATALHVCAASGRRQGILAAALPQHPGADAAAAANAPEQERLEDILQRVRRALAQEQPVDAEACAPLCLYRGAQAVACALRCLRFAASQYKQSALRHSAYSLLLPS